MQTLPFFLHAGGQLAGFVALGLVVLGVGAAIPAALHLRQYRATAQREREAEFLAQVRQ